MGQMFFVAAQVISAFAILPEAQGLQLLRGMVILQRCVCSNAVIELASFTATPKISKVILQWSTESEIDNAGFNLYRSESEDGEYVKINDFPDSSSRFLHTRCIV